MTRKIVSLAILIVASITTVAGLTQIIAPRFAMSLVGAETTPTSALFFAIIGMFMALFGSLMLQTLYSAVPSRPAVLWCAFHKLGACASVSLGVAYGIFSPLAAVVSVFDLFCAGLYLFYLKRLYSDEAG